MRNKREAAKYSQLTVLYCAYTAHGDAIADLIKPERT